MNKLNSTYLVFAIFVLCTLMVALTSAETIVWDSDRVITENVKINPEDTLIISSGNYTFEHGSIVVQGVILVESNDSSVLFLNEPGSSSQQFIVLTSTRKEASRIDSVTFIVTGDETSLKTMILISASHAGSLEIANSTLTNGQDVPSITHEGGLLAVISSRFQGSKAIKSVGGEIVVQNSAFNGDFSSETGFQIDATCDESNEGRRIDILSNEFSAKSVISSVCGNLHVEDNSATVSRFLVFQSGCISDNCTLVVRNNKVFITPEENKEAFRINQKLNTNLFVRIESNTVIENPTNTTSSSAVFRISCSQGVFDDNFINADFPALLEYSVEKDSQPGVTGQFQITNNVFSSTQNNLIIKLSNPIESLSYRVTKGIRVNRNTFYGLLSIETPAGSAPINATENTWENVSDADYRSRVRDFLSDSACGLALINPVLVSGTSTEISEDQIILEPTTISDGTRYGSNYVFFDELTIQSSTISGNGSILVFKKLNLNTVDWLAGDIVIGEGALPTTLDGVKLSRSLLSHRSLLPLTLNRFEVSSTAGIESSGPLSVSNSILFGTSRVPVKVSSNSVEGSYSFIGNSFSGAKGALVLESQRNPDAFQVTVESNTFKSLDSAISTGIPGIRVLNNDFSDVLRLVTVIPPVSSKLSVFEFTGNNVTNSVEGLTFGHELKQDINYKNIVVSNNKFVNCDCDETAAIVDIDHKISLQTLIEITGNSYIDNYCSESEVRVYLESTEKYEDDPVTLSISKNIFKSKKPPVAIPDEIIVEKKNLFPYGFAWDPATDVFVVGSIDGVIYSIGIDGTITQILAEPRIQGVPVLKLLLNPEKSVMFALATNATFAALLKISIEDWKVKSYIDLGASVPDPESLLYFGDITSDSDGNVYTIHAALGYLVKIAEDESVSIITISYPPSDEIFPEFFNGITIVKGNQLLILRGDELFLYHLDKVESGAKALKGLYNTMTRASTLETKDDNTVLIASPDRNRIWSFSIDEPTYIAEKTVSTRRRSPIATVSVRGEIFVLNSRVFGQSQVVHKFYIARASFPLNHHGPRESSQDSVILRPETLLRPRSIVSHPVLGFIVSSESTGTISVESDGELHAYITEFEGNRTLAQLYDAEREVYYVTYTSNQGEQAFLAEILLSTKEIVYVTELSAAIPEGYSGRFDPVGITRNADIIYVVDSFGGWVWTVNEDRQVEVLYESSEWLGRIDQDGVTGIAWFNNTLLLSNTNFNGLVVLDLYYLTVSLLKLDVTHPRAVAVKEETIYVLDDNSIIEINGEEISVTATMYTNPTSIVIDKNTEIYILYSEIKQNSSQFFIERGLYPINADGTKLLSIRENNLYPSSVSCSQYTGTYLASLGHSTIYHISEHGEINQLVNSSDIGGQKPVQMAVNVNVGEIVAVFVDDVNCQSCAPKLLRTSLDGSKIAIVDLYQLSNRAMNNAYAIAFDYRTYYISEPYTGVVWLLSQQSLTVVAQDPRLGNANTFGIKSMRYTNGKLIAGTSDGKVYRIGLNRVDLIQIDGSMNLDDSAPTTITSLDWLNKEENTLSIAAVVGSESKIFVVATDDEWNSAYIERVIPSYYDEQLALCFDGIEHVYAVPRYYEKFLAQEETAVFQMYQVPIPSNIKAARKLLGHDVESRASESSISISILYPIKSEANIIQNEFSNLRAQHELYIGSYPDSINATLNYWGGRHASESVHSFFAIVLTDPSLATSNLNDLSNSNLIYENTATSSGPYPEETIESSEVPIEASLSLQESNPVPIPPAVTSLDAPENTQLPSFYPEETQIPPAVTSLDVSSSAPIPVPTNSSSSHTPKSSKLAGWKTALIVIGVFVIIILVLATSIAVIFIVQQRASGSSDSFKQLETPLAEYPGPRL